MGGSAGMIGRAVQAGGGFGGKGSGMGRSDYAQGFTPVGQAPARTQAPVQQPQATPREPQYIPGVAQTNPQMGFMQNQMQFQQPFQPQFQQPFQPQFGGKSSGLGQMGMMNSPFGGFNPYVQQPMMPQQQFNPMMGGLPGILGLLRGGYFAEGGQIKEEDEE